MKDAIASWHFKNKPVFDECYAGGFQSPGTFELELELWNNRNGLEDVKDLSNSKLIVAFKDYEDSIYLKHLRIVFDHSQQADLLIDGNRAYVNIPKVILGTANSGETGAYNNYTTITITFKDSPSFKNDLKQLLLDVQ